MSAATLILAGVQVATATAAGPAITAELSGQVFIRARATLNAKDTWAGRYDITRARLSATFRYGEVLRGTIEPDFAGVVCTAAGSVCDEADVSDVFLQVSPVEELDLRIGQAKTPYGAIESMNEWRLPAQRRGLVSELVSSRLGFGGRVLGAKVRARPGLPLKPSLEAGIYADPENNSDLDFAARLGIKPMKGARVELAGYARANSSVDAGYGQASALAFTYERGAWFGIAEVMLGRARHLSIDGTATGNAVFLAGRLLAAHAIELGAFEIEPYLGLDVFDPSTALSADRGIGLRGGVNFYFMRLFRLSAELERRTGEAAFVAPQETVVSIMTGVSFE